MGELISGFNWVDYVIIVSFLAFLILGLRRGFIGGIFWLTGLIVASILSLHYYPIVANFAAKSTNLPFYYFGIISYVLIIAVTLLVFWSLRLVFNLLVKAEALKGADRIGSTILAIGQTLIMTSLIVIFLLFSSVSYFEKAVLHSSLSRIFIQPAARIYIFAWDTVLNRFLPTEEFNQEIENLTNF